MSLATTLRKIEKIRFYISLFIVGVLFTVISLFVLFAPKTEYATANGVIERIEAFATSADDSESYNVYVTFIDGNGTEHKDVLYPSYDSSMKPGDAVEVLYNPKSPDEIQAPGGDFIPYIILAVGIIAIAVSVIKVATAKKSVNKNSPFESDPVISNAASATIDNADEPVRDYYFHWTGKMNQSYVLETTAREPACEAICDHMGVLKQSDYTFINRITGKTQEHKISHTVTKGYGDDLGGATIRAVASSDFKIDDVNNWDYLAGLGYSVVPKRTGIKLNFDVLRGGVPVAFLEAAGTNILKDGAKNPLGDKLPSTGLYKVSCKKSDLDGVFMACFCVSRVEFY